MRAPIASRAAERGAALAEALVVIVAFVLALLGAVYLRSYHLHRLRAMRFSRVASLAYATSGCPQPAPAYLTRRELQDTRAPVLDTRTVSMEQALAPFLGGNDASHGNDTLSSTAGSAGRSLFSIPYAHARTEAQATARTNDGANAREELTRRVRFSGAALCVEPIADRDSLNLFTDISRYLGGIP